jgi:hypothetical protein
VKAPNFNQSVQRAPTHCGLLLCTLITYCVFGGVEANAATLSSRCVQDVRIVAAEINRDVSAYPKHEKLAKQLVEYPKPDPSFIFSLLWSESRDNVCVTSSVGAQGIAQFMPATAMAECGLTDLRDMPANVKCATRYVSELMRQFSTPRYRSYRRNSLVAAAYNHGPLKVDKAIDAVNKTCFPKSVEPDRWLECLHGPEASIQYVRDVTGPAMELAKAVFYFNGAEETSERENTQAARDLAVAARGRLTDQMHDALDEAGWIDPPSEKWIHESQGAAYDFGSKGPCVSWIRIIDANYLRSHQLDEYVQGLDHGGYVGFEFQVSSTRQAVEVVVEQKAGRYYEALARQLLLMYRFAPHVVEYINSVKKDTKTGCEHDSDIRQMHFIFTRTPYGNVERDVYTNVTFDAPLPDPSWLEVVEALGHPNPIKTLVANEQDSDDEKAVVEKIQSKFMNASPQGYFAWRTDYRGKTTISKGGERVTIEGDRVEREEFIKDRWIYMADTWPSLTWPVMNSPFYLGPCHDAEISSEDQYTCFFAPTSNWLIYVDPHTKLPTMIRDVTLLSAPVTFTFEDYRRRGPIQIPFTEKVKGPGLNRELRLLNLDVDVPLADDVFESRTR